MHKAIKRIVIGLRFENLSIDYAFEICRHGNDKMNAILIFHVIFARVVWGTRSRLMNKH